MTVLIPIVKFIHLIAIVVWVGGVVFFSLIAAPSIFKVLARQLAGDVVGDIFPKYWLMGYACSTLALSTLLFLSYSEDNYPYARLLILFVMAVLSFFSGLVLGRKAAAIKAKMKSEADAETKDALRARFGKIHAVSSVMNMTVMALGVVVVFLTSMEL